MRRVLRGALVALSLLAGVATAVPATASGLLNHEAAGVEVDWSGLYVGAHAGYGWGRLDTNLAGDIHVDGWLAGGQVGLQRQFDRWVVGIEASFSFGELDGSRTFDVPGIGATNFKASVSDILMVTARLGYAWQNRLIYVKGGYASADLDLKITTAGGTFSRDSRIDGWTAGFGFERQLTRNISIGLEYNYLDLGSTSYSFTGGGGPVLTLASVKYDPYCDPKKTHTGRLDPDGIHTVMARVNFRLGSEPQHVPYK